jgi:hypothetical protein
VTRLRLPYRVQPVKGEALSSWLSRVAEWYGMTPKEFIRDHVGDPDLTTVDVDRHPPQAFLEWLNKATGFTAEQIERMTLSSPELRIPPLEAEGEPTFDPLHGMFESRSRPGDWSSGNLATRHCPECSQALGRHFSLLIWRIPLVNSCHVHGWELEEIRSEGRWYSLPRREMRFRAAEAAVISQDRRTAEATSSPNVALTRGIVRSEEWLAFLHAKANEILTPGHLDWAGSDDRELGLASIDRAGKHLPRTIESLGPPAQRRVMRAVARLLYGVEQGTRVASANLVEARLAPEGSSQPYGWPLPIPVERFL